MPRLLWPSWRWITISGTPSRASSTACACRSWCVGPLAATRRAGEDAEERPDGQFESALEPRLELGPSPRVHADLAAAPTLATPDEQRATALIEIGLSERQRLADAQP